MRVILNQVTKKFKKDIVFHDLSLAINPGDTLGISGPNGSGKSTLLKILSGHTAPSKGERIYTDNLGNKIDEDLVFGKISFAAPYIELIEEFTLPEILTFYKRFRTPYISSVNELTTLTGIPFRQRPIKDYSSGMKQRVKLLLALCFHSEIVLLDEPSTNLDREGVTWTQKLIGEFLNDRTLVIASNEPDDFTGLRKVIDILDYKLNKEK